MPLGKLLPALVASVCIPCTLYSDNWPRFRGPNGTGVSADKDIPIHFDADKGILWKVPIPGVGNSSPIVWKDRLFLQSATADHKQRHLLCIDVADGKILWTRTISGVFFKFSQKGSSPASATPTTDGERVYAAQWDGKDIVMHAYDFEGNPVWERNLGPFKSQHGAGASPIIIGNLLYYAKDQDDSSILFAFAPKSGEIVWKQSRPHHRACYSAPFLLERPGAAPELIVTSTKGITSYHPQLGEVNWDWKWQFKGKLELRTIVAPVIVNDMLIATSGDGGGDRYMAAVKLSGNGTATRPSLAWDNSKDFPYVPNPLSRGKHIYFVNDKGVAGCYEAATGKRVWFERLEGGTFVSSPVMIDGKIYAASEEGDVFVIAAEPIFRLLAKNPLGECFRATPAVADNRLYLRGQSHLFCIGTKKSR